MFASTATSHSRKNASPPSALICATVSSPCGTSTSITATLAPSFAKSSAVPLPIPCAAPVISATFPANLAIAPKCTPALTVSGEDRADLRVAADERRAEVGELRRVRRAGQRRVARVERHLLAPCPDLLARRLPGERAHPIGPPVQRHTADRHQLDPRRQRLDDVLPRVGGATLEDQ